MSCTPVDAESCAAHAAETALWRARFHEAFLALLTTQCERDRAVTRLLGQQAVIDDLRLRLSHFSSTAVSFRTMRTQQSEAGR